MFIGKITAGVFISTAATVVLFAQYSLCNVILTTPEATTNANSTEIVSTEEIREHHDDIEEYEDYLESHSSEVSAEESLTQQILDFAESETSAFSKKSLKSFRMFFEKVVPEINAYNAANKAELHSESDIFKEFLEELKEMEEHENDIDSFSLLKDITIALEEYNATLTSDSSNKEDKFINELLQKYNFASLLSELQTNAKHFMKTFKSNIHKIAEKGNVSEGDFERRYKGFVDFIGIYDDTSLFGERE